MKKLFLCLLSALLLTACAGVQEAQNLANCKFALKSVELTNYNLTSFDFDVVVAITNLNKKQAAALKRFDGKLTVRVGTGVLIKNPIALIQKVEKVLEERGGK